MEGKAVSEKFKPIWTSGVESNTFVTILWWEELSDGIEGWSRNYVLSRRENMECMISSPTYGN